MIFIVYLIVVLGIAAVVAPSIQNESPGLHNLTLVSDISSGPLAENALSKTSLAGSSTPNPVAPVSLQSAPPIVSDPPMATSSSVSPVTEPIPKISIPPDARPLGSHFEFLDSNRRQVVSVSVRNFALASRYSYYYNDPSVPDEIRVSAKPGNKFFFVGVIWDLVEFRGDGSRTTFGIPSVTSYKLISRDVSYYPTDPNTLTNILQDAIIGIGPVLKEKSIDKDNPGVGFLIFEVPETVSAGDSYVELCAPSLINLDDPHSPPGNCSKDPVRWRLTF